MPSPLSLLGAALIGLAVVVALAIAALAVLTARLTERVEADVPPIGAFVEIDGHRLHHRASGPEGAPAIVLLHGASAHLGDFETTLRPALEDRFRVIAFDRPGSGWSEPVDGAAGEPGRQAALVAAALERLGVERAVWIGHSWGGAVALAAAVERPDAVAGAALLAAPTAPWDGPPLPWPLRLGAVPGLRFAFSRTLVTPIGRHSLADLLRDSFRPETAPEPIERYERATGAALGITPERFVATARDMVGLSPALARLAPRLAEIEPPLLLVYGERDPAMPPARHARPLAEAAREAELIVLPGAGHLVHHTRTAEVARAIARFAEAVTSP